MQKDTQSEHSEDVTSPGEPERREVTLACLSPASFWTPRHLVESAWHEHAPFAFWLVEAVKPRVVVELGTHTGFSFLAFCQAVQQLSLATDCYAIDTWLGDEHAGFYGAQVFQTLGAVQSQEYGAFSHLIRARFDDALTSFGDGTIDLLHIDGRHCYEDVVDDYSKWAPKLSDSAVVLFHDIKVRERDFGVWRFWEEISKRHPSFEFAHGHGLGVLCPGTVVPDRLRALLDAQEAACIAIRKSYAMLGAAVSVRYQLMASHRQLAERDTTIARLDSELQSRSVALTRAAEEAQALAGQIREQTETMRAQGLTIDSYVTRVGTIYEVARGRGAIGVQNEKPARSGAVQESSVMSGGLDELHSLVEHLAGDLVVAQSRQRDLGERAARSEHELAQIQASTMWRAFLKLRAAVSHVPMGTRGLARKALKAAWWAATPHRMPARMRFLRARRAAVTFDPLVSRALYPEGKHLVYSPVNSKGADGFTRVGQYRLSETGAGYVYVPPRKPDDIDVRIAALEARPSFSIVVPLYNTPPELFDAMVDSVLAQWYPDWELVLIDDKSPQPEVRARLASLDDSRIRSILLDENRGISGATNAGLDAARGDYIVFLDHDDELTCDCLYELAKCIAEENPDYVYSDEDKIEMDGTYGQPFFKPDWSPDAMMSTMYTCHVSCVRRSLQQEIGGLKSEFDGSQDWDFVLRVTERAKKISHVRKVLYHWRVIPASVASDLNAKPYAVDAGRRAREAAIERRGLMGAMEPVSQLPGYYRARYAPIGTPLVSIVIPSKNNGDVLLRCVESIRTRSTYRNVEIVLLDNGSTKTSTLQAFEQMAQMPNTKVIRHVAPFNYSEINNLGVRHSSGEFLVFLNDDTEVITERWLEDLLGYAQLDHVGAVGAKLIYPGGRRVQHAGLVNLPGGPNHAFILEDADSPGYFARNLLEYNWVAVTGACLMLSRANFERIGGFDEAFPVAYNDVDLCFRLVEAGLYNVVCPGVELIHYESLSRGRDDANTERIERLRRDKERLYLKHPNFFMFDPFHNPNLDQRDLNFTIPAA